MRIQQCLDICCLLKELYQNHFHCALKSPFQLSKVKVNLYHVTMSTYVEPIKLTRIAGKKIDYGLDFQKELKCDKSIFKVHSTALRCLDFLISQMIPFILISESIWNDWLLQLFNSCLLTEIPFDRNLVMIWNCGYAC